MLIALRLANARLGLHVMSRLRGPRVHACNPIWKVV